MSAAITHEPRPGNFEMGSSFTCAHDQSGIVILDNVGRYTGDPLTGYETSGFFIPNWASTAKCLAEAITLWEYAAGEGQQSCDISQMFSSILVNSHTADRLYQSVVPNQDSSHYGYSGYRPQLTGSSKPARRCVSIHRDGWDKALRFVPMSEPGTYDTWGQFVQALRDTGALRGDYVKAGVISKEELDSCRKVESEPQVFSESVIKQQVNGAYVFVPVSTAPQ